MTGERFAIIEAPSVLGLFPEGVEMLPDALLAVGLAERLGARHGGRIEPPAYDPTRDPETLLLNPSAIADYSIALADAVGGRRRRGRVPGGARWRLLDLARLPSGAQAPRPLRAPVPRRSRRLLSTRGRAERRGRVDGPGAGHRPRARGAYRSRRPAAARARRRTSSCSAGATPTTPRGTAASASRTPRSR